MKKQHFEILLEEMNSKLDAVLESYAAVRAESNGKHDYTASVVQTLSNKIDDVNERVTAESAKLGQRIDAVETKLGQRIDGVEKKIDTVNERVTAESAKLGRKIDALTDELHAHRDNTEIHQYTHGVAEE